MRRRRFSSIVGSAALASLASLPAMAQEAPAPHVDHAVDLRALRDMADRLAATAANIHAVLVVHAGQLVFERYLAGVDEIPGRFFGRRNAHVMFDADTLHDMKSVSKSVASLVLGMVIDRGLVRSENEPVFSFFPELADLRTPDKDRILLSHVLRMTTGLEWLEASAATGDFFNDEARMNMAADRCRYVLGRPSTASSGQTFHYSTGALALVAAIVRKATGMPLDAFARLNLFEPMGIGPVEWARTAGDTDAGAGLRLRPRDMAKIGQLVLGGGRWNGQQIVSKAWIDASTDTSTQATDGQTYGYLWWGGRAAAHRRPVHWVGALGRGGQSIRIVPALGLVVVVTAGYYQDYSEQAFRTQYGVFRDVLQAVSVSG